MSGVGCINTNAVSTGAGKQASFKDGSDGIKVEGLTAAEGMKRKTKDLWSNCQYCHIFSHFSYILDLYFQTSLLSLERPLIFVACYVDDDTSIDLS